MISKKLATALGAGTLGAGGAAGAAALKLGLIGNKITLSSSDIKALSSSNWKAKEAKTNHGEVSIEVEAEKEGETWKCTIKGFIFGSDKSKSQKIEEQVKNFVEEIKKDSAKRDKFVENCAKARLTKEKEGGKESTIELEIEEVGSDLKLKNLDSLLSSDFVGLERLEENHQINLANAEDMEFSVKKENKNLVVKLENDDKHFCSIYGKFEETDFNDSDFDYGALSTIFMGTSLNGQVQQSEADKLANYEKRKFFTRNCLKYNRKIEGMKAVQESGKWKFKNLEEELLTKMYEYPKTKKE